MGSKSDAITTTDKKGILKIPTMQDLITFTETDYKQNQLMAILNQPPHQTWLTKHPMTKMDYLPIERVEWLLTRIYGKWWTEIKDVKVLANSVVVVVRLFVKNPITGEVESNDGVGAVAIQTDKGAGAMDWNATKADGVMKAAPAAKSYAVKDAADMFGKIFGKDLTRKQQIDYMGLLKTPPEITLEDITGLFEIKKEAMNESDRVHAERIINNKEMSNYEKLHNQLKDL